MPEIKEALVELRLEFDGAQFRFGVSRVSVLHFDVVGTLLTTVFRRSIEYLLHTAVIVTLAYSYRLHLITLE